MQTNWVELERQIELDLKDLQIENGSNDTIPISTKDFYKIPKTTKYPW